MTDDLEYSDTSIYDEIYGYIRVTDQELKIIDTSLFQRLNHIKQMGMAYRVFPGAHHTRFSHSLGVMHIVDEMAKNLKLEKEDRQKLRLAALLHDIGHYPLSHTIEVVLSDHNKNEEGRHESFGKYLIENSSLKDVLETYAPAEVSEIITGESSELVYNQLMSSELDADRIDYLLRDSFHTGVVYGRFDINRILDTLCLDESGRVAIEEDGKHAAEGFLIGRYLMWATVYTHKTIAGFDELVQHAYIEIADSKYKKVEELKKLVTENEDEWVTFDDHYVMTRIHQNHKDNDFLKAVREMFLQREHLVIADEAKGITREERGYKKYFLLDEYEKEERLKELAESSNVPEKWIFHNNSSNQLPTLKPSILEAILGGEEAREEFDREMSKALHIRKKDRKSEPLVNDKDSIAYYLQNLSLDTVRIFTRECWLDGLKKAIQSRLAS